MKTSTFYTNVSTTRKIKREIAEMPEFIKSSALLKVRLLEVKKKVFINAFYINIRYTFRTI